ncbi:glycosyltransferase family 4 protein [Portibacter lacus]|uniref:Glycosyl transferase family 1 n=1 Tax=Portibacter lacus TaxID=1099794 RepID=A0AA37WFK6_9BACT|nr:glycosyltransferase family 1 protein [Portibacter lacus]GLR17774.1 glycosyl transferase family 1 [Portibacter lacus]
MRIAVNTRVLLKGRMEGVCRYIHETTKRMVRNHPEDEFIFLFDRTFHPSFIYGPNVTPVVIPPPTRDPILWKIWFDFSVPRALKKYNADVFLSGDTYLSMKTEVPTVLISHDIAYAHFPEHLPNRVLKYYQNNFPDFHQKAEQIVAVSSFTKDDIISEYNLESSKVSVAYNATPDGFSPFTEDEKRLVRKKHAGGSPFFIYVGSLHPRKNIGNLIKGFLEFKQKNKTHKLILLGRKAWNFEEYEKMIDASPDIIFLDGNQFDPREVLPAASGLAYISLHEGFGIPILEGMSAGVPVITSSVTSMPEVAGKAAILVNPNSTSEIAFALQEIADNDQSEMIKKGFENTKRFNWDKSAATIYDAIKKTQKK